LAQKPRWYVTGGALNPPDQLAGIVRVKHVADRDFKSRHLTVVNVWPCREAVLSHWTAKPSVRPPLPVWGPAPCSGASLCTRFRFTAHRLTDAAAGRLGYSGPRDGQAPDQTAKPLLGRVPHPRDAG
jgi:hypothetical protein